MTKNESSVINKNKAHTNKYLLIKLKIFGTSIKFNLSLMNSAVSLISSVYFSNYYDVY